MANTKSAKKAIRSSSKKKQLNLIWKRKLLKSKNIFKEALGQKPKVEVKKVKDLLEKTKKIADKAATHGSIHKNKSAKIKSGLDKGFFVWAK